jgi:hypothetical protein
MLELRESTLSLLATYKFNKAKPSVTLRVNFLRKSYFLNSTVCLEQFPYFGFGCFECQIFNDELVRLDFLNVGLDLSESRGLLLYVLFLLKFSFLMFYFFFFTSGC